MQHTKVLILNCFSRNALAAINSIDTEYTLYGGAPHNKFSFLDSFFRHEKLKKILRYTSPSQNKETYKNDIIDIIIKNDIDIVIPTGTTETDLLSYFKDEIESQTNCKLLVETYKTLSKLTDKNLLMEQAKTLNLSIPLTRFCQTISDLESNIKTGTINFPLITKPIRSYASKGLFIFKNMNEFKNFLDSKESANYREFIVQEFIDGEIYDACMLSENGKTIYGLTQCRKMTWGNTGSGIINITTKDPEAIQIASTLLEHTNFTGISMFEFIKRNDDGKFFLIECNPKIWGTTDLTIQAGLNIVQDYIDLIIFNQNIPPKQYEADLLYKWVFPECLSSMILKKPRGLKTFLSEYKKTINNYHANRVILNTQINSWKSLFLEILNKA